VLVAGKASTGAAPAGLALIPLLLALTPAVVALALGRVQPA
jgi:hypothetical protein